MSAPEAIAPEAIAPEAIAPKANASPSAARSEDEQAVIDSMFWLELEAPPDLAAPYRGMYLAVFDKRIVDADRDGDALYARLKSDGQYPIDRIFFRYIPTDEEARRQMWIR